MARRWGPGVVVLLLTVAVLLVEVAASPGASSTTRPRPAQSLYGAVAADGTAETPTPGWNVARLGPGRYVLGLGRSRPAVRIRSWDAVADAIVVPRGRGDVEVIFDRDGLRVDTRFRFDAVLHAARSRVGRQRVTSR